MSHIVCAKLIAINGSSWNFKKEKEARHILETTFNPLKIDQRSEKKKKSKQRVFFLHLPSKQAVDAALKGNILPTASYFSVTIPQ